MWLGGLGMGTRDWGYSNKILVLAQEMQRAARTSSILSRARPRPHRPCLSTRTSRTPSTSRTASDTAFEVGSSTLPRRNSITALSFMLGVLWFDLMPYCLIWPPVEAAADAASPEADVEFGAAAPEQLAIVASKQLRILLRAAVEGSK